MYFLYILSLHFLWAVFATAVNININRKSANVENSWKNIGKAFLINFIICPIAIGFALNSELSRGKKS